MAIKLLFHQLLLLIYNQHVQLFLTMSNIRKGAAFASVGWKAALTTKPRQAGLCYLVTMYFVRYNSVTNSGFFILTRSLSTTGALQYSR